MSVVVNFQFVQLDYLDHQGPEQVQLWLYQLNLSCTGSRLWSFNLYNWLTSITRTRATLTPSSFKWNSNVINYNKLNSLQFQIEQQCKKLYFVTTILGGSNVFSFNMNRNINMLNYIEWSILGHKSNMLFMYKIVIKNIYNIFSQKSLFLSFYQDCNWCIQHN
jgi:hypothetical protein